MKAMRLIVFVLLALLLVPTMACGGAGEQRPTPGVTPTPGMMPTPTVTLTPTPTPTKQGEFRMDNIRLCSDVRESDDYDLSRDATYVRGQVIFVLFDVYGVTTTKNDGQWEAHLRVEKLALFGPEGEEVVTKTEVLEFRETFSTGTVDSLWIFFAAPLAGPLGEYFVEVTIRDVPSGDTDIAKASFTVENSPLAVDHLYLCSEIRGFRDYTIQPGSIYHPGETVWVYLDVLGASVGGGKEVWLKVPHLLLYDPQDRLALRTADLLSERVPYDGLSGAFLFLFLNLPVDTQHGQYRVELTVEDGWTGEAVVETFNFMVE